MGGIWWTVPRYFLQCHYDFIIFYSLLHFVCCLCPPDIWLYTPTSPRRLTSLNLGKGRCTGWQRSVKTGGSKAPHWELLPPGSSQETTSPPCPGQWAQAWSWGQLEGIVVIQLPKELCHPSKACSSHGDEAWRTVQYLTCPWWKSDWLPVPECSSAAYLPPATVMQLYSKCNFNYLIQVR